MLIHVGQLIGRGIAFGEACELGLVLPITDDPDIRRALGSAIAACA